MNVKCQACGASFIAPDDKIRGRVLTYKCRRCGAAMRVDGSHLSVGTGTEVEAEERQSYLPMAPESGPMGQSPAEDVESGWSEPSEVAEKVNVPHAGAFKAPGVPKDLTPKTPPSEPSWDPSVGEGERPTMVGSADALVAVMMEEPPARDSAAPTARKPDLEAALRGSELEAHTNATPTPAPAAGAPAVTPAAPVAAPLAPVVPVAAKPVIPPQPAPLVSLSNKGGLPAALAAGPKMSGGTVPGGLGRPPGVMGTPGPMRSPLTPAPMAVAAATSAPDQTPTPIAAKAAVDLTPTPLITRPATATLEQAAARTVALPAPKPPGGASQATPSSGDPTPILVAPGAKKNAPTAATTTEDSGLFDLRSLLGGDAPPVVQPGALKQAPAKPPPPARSPPPKPNAAAGAPAKTPPPKPTKPAPRSDAVGASLEVDVETGAEDAETEPAPLVANTIPAVVAEAATVADEESPPSSDIVPISLSEIDDAPTSVVQGAVVVPAEAAGETAVQGDGPPVASSDETASPGGDEPAPTPPPRPASTPEPVAAVAIRDLPTVAAERFKNPPKPTNGAQAAPVDADPFAMGGSSAAAAPMAGLDLGVSTTAKTIPPSARVSRPPTPEELGNGVSKAPIIAGVLLLVLGGGVFLATRAGDEAKPPEAPTAARTGDGPKADTTATPPVADTTVAAITAEPTKEPTPAKIDTPKTGDAAKPAAGDAKPSGGDPRPSGGDPKPSGGDPKPSGGDPKPSGGDPKPSGGDAKPPEVTPTPIKAVPASGTAPIDKGAVASAMGVAASSAGACKPADGTGGVARVSVTFSTSGRATQALVNGPPFAGTPTGGCIASKFRSVSIPPFAGEPVTVHKTVSF